MEIDKAEVTVEALRFDENAFKSSSAPALIHWLAVAERTIESLEVDTLSPLIPSLHSAFSRLLIPSTPLPTATTSTSLPKPGRPIRHLISRCMVNLHTRCESRLLFDFTQGLLKYVVEGNGSLGKANAGESIFKVACWYTIGEIMQNLGSNMMSFMSEIAVTAIKLIRTPAQQVILRYHATAALTKSLKSAGKAVPDPIAKDLLKHLRNGLSDGADAIQRASSDALIALSQCTSMISTLQDIEGTVSLAMKSLEKADYPTRIAISRMIAHFLAATQQAVIAPTPAPAKGKKSVATDEGEDPVTIVTSAADTGTKTMLTLPEMLKVLSGPHNRSNQGRRTRNAIIGIYAALLEKLGAQYVESHYAEIVKHLMTEIVSAQRSRSTRHEILGTREVVGLLLRDLIGVKLLSEQGQGTAIRELVNSYLKTWPALLPGQAEANELVLVVALKEVAGLLQQLGNASPALQEILQDPLLRLLSHPSIAVQTHAAWCLRMYATTTPLRLPQLINAVFDSLEKDLAMVGTPASPSDLQARCSGRGLALAALVAVIPERPLYVSYEISTKIMDLAVFLLKRAGEHDISAAVIEIQVAWTLISALLSLGPGFVKLHLPQLLILWRNALPKPTSKDSSVGERGEAEWSFLLVVRESALMAMLSFLRGSARNLATLDVARRITSLLTNTLNFVNGFSTAYADYLKEEQQRNPGDASSVLSTSRLKLADRENYLRRRVLQCFKELGQSSATESAQPALIQAAVGMLAEPENALIAATATQAAIQASSGSFTSIWEATDGYAFGVSSFGKVAEAQDDLQPGKGSGKDAIERLIQSQLSRPVLKSLENDTIYLCLTDVSIDDAETPDPSTGVVDAAVDLFEELLPLQSVNAIMQGVTLMNNHLRSPKMERNPGRRQAVFYNVIVSLSRALQKAERAGSRRTRDSVGHSSVTGLVKGLLQEAVTSDNETIRNHAAEALGALCSIAGGAFMSPQCQWLVDQIVSSRSAGCRAGCAMALAAVYCHVGSLSAGSLLRTADSILVSLATDPHPLVHFWAIHALSRVTEAAGLSFSPYVNKVLSLLADVYNSEAHEPEGGSLGSANLRGDLALYPEACRLLSACIGVLGPEMQVATLDRDLASDLEREFSKEADDGVAVEAMKCLQQFLMFAPSIVDIPPLVQTFRSHLGSRRKRLRIAAITALYQIVQRDALLMSKLGGNQLVEDLFSLLDEDPTLEAVKKVILNWLEQTAAGTPCGWIDLCLRVLQRTQQANGKAQVSTDASGFQDDEGQSLGASVSSAETSMVTRWRTQLFALNCVHEVVRAVAISGREEHTNAVLGKQMNVNPRLLLVSRISDLIRMAFSASTAQTEDVRLAGLEVLRDVVQTFSRSPDPDFAGALLLEQHQAPIAAALTPSFSPDAAPEVLAAAIQVCASFVGSGVVREVGKMGRILKLMTGALLRCKEGNSTESVEAEALSSNAFIMVKIATLSAWAELQSTAGTQTYLQDVIEPQEAILAPLWIGSLKDYALIRTDPETTALSAVSGSLDLAQSGIGRETLLPYYEKASLVILGAVAVALRQRSSSIQQAMRDRGPGPAIPNEFDHSDAGTPPVPNFFVVYGLAFELLTNSINETAESETGLVALEALSSLVDAELSGTALFKSTIFDELCTVCYRIAMLGSAKTKAKMVEVMEAFVTSRGATCEAEQSRRVLAVVTYALKSSIGSSETPSSFLREDSASDRAAFAASGFRAYAEIVKYAEPTEQFALLLVAQQMYSDMVGDESAGPDYASATLPSLRLLLDSGFAATANPVTFGRAVHALLSAGLNNLDALRNRQGPSVEQKVKTNMLMLVLILTSIPASVPISRPVIEQICYAIGQRAAENTEASVTALQCIRALLMASMRGVAALQYSAAQLLPQLIRYMAVIAEIVDSPEPDATTLGGAEEAMRILVAFANSADEKQKPQIYAVLLPTLLLLLDPQSQTPIHDLTVRHLLELVTAAPQAFKEAMTTVPDQAKETLESSMRQALVQRKNGAPNAKAKAQISLKTFG